VDNIKPSTERKVTKVLGIYLHNILQSAEYLGICRCTPLSLESIPFRVYHNFSVSNCKNIVSTAKTVIISKPAPAGVSGVALKGK